MTNLYHGSDSNVEMFSFDFIKSGAGVTHQGIGFYFSNSADLAETYMGPNGGLFEVDVRGLDRFVSIDEAPSESLIHECLDKILDEDTLDDLVDTFSGVAPMSEDFQTTKHKIYNFLSYADSDFLDNIDDYQFEDDAERDAALSLLNDLKDKGFQLSEGDDYRELYKSLMISLDDDFKAVNKVLSEINIPGFTFQDGRTESYGPEAMNYVVFDLSVIKTINLIKSPTPTARI